MTEEQLEQFKTYLKISTNIADAIIKEECIRVCKKIYFMQNDTDLTKFGIIDSPTNKEEIGNLYEWLNLLFESKSVIDK